MSGTRKSRKHIAVIGLGQFGGALARALAPKCEVAAIDLDDALVNAIADDVALARVLDARDLDSLGTVIGRTFDEAVVTMTESLEASVLTVLHCKQLGVPCIRAKAVSDDHAAVLRAVGATDVIFPERETALRLAAQIQDPNLLDFVPVGSGFSVLDVVPPPAFAGQTLTQLELRARYGVFVLAVRTGPTGFQLLPGPDHVVEAGEVLVVIGSDADLLRLKQAGARSAGDGGPTVTPLVPPHPVGAGHPPAGAPAPLPAASAATATPPPAPTRTPKKSAATTPGRKKGAKKASKKASKNASKKGKRA